MLRTLIAFVLIFFISNANSQATDTSTTDKGVKDLVLQDIQRQFESNKKSVESNVTSLNRKIDSLNLRIAESRSSSDKVTTLQERIKTIEEKQKAVESAELNVYQANYQSAVINLVSMEREIKPLILFNATRDFFTALDEVSNPMTYQGYNKWYKQFRDYVDNGKDNNAVLNVTSALLKFTGTVTGIAPLTGTVSQALFSSMATYVDGVNKKKKDLKTQSEKMFALTMKLSQFQNDRNAIEAEWQNITKELQELQKYYDKIQAENFIMLSVKPGDFKQSFTVESDANRRREYLNELSNMSSFAVENLQITYPKAWKEKVYYQMMDIQALKIRFGNITFKVKENINKYSPLIQKYKNDEDLGAKLPVLETRLKTLSSTFEDNFNPLDYVNSATRMYKVY